MTNTKGKRTMKDSLYGELTVIGMKGSESFVERVDNYLKEWRRHTDEETYLAHASTPRFGSGEGKGMISHFVGGIVAFNSKNNVIGGEISNCANDAPISLNNPANYGASGEYTMVGGIVGYAQMLDAEGLPLFHVSDCVNTKNGKLKLTVE